MSHYRVELTCSRSCSCPSCVHDPSERLRAWIRRNRYIVCLWGLVIHVILYMPTELLPSLAEIGAFHQGECQDSAWERNARNLISTSGMSDDREHADSR
jgi:hypothetical protein